MFMFLIANHRRHQSLRSFMANHCRKHSHLLRSVLWALLRPSIDTRMKTLRMQTIIHDLSGVPYGVLCIPIFVSSCGNTHSAMLRRHGRKSSRECVNSVLSFWTLKAQTLPLSLNVLMLYGNMEQLAKLSVSIFGHTGLDWP